MLPRVIYLGGLGRSGTTLLERMLGELPGVCSAGEVVHLWQRGVADADRCGCGKPFPDCPFWSEVGAEAFGGWANVDVRRLGELRHSVDRNRHLPMLAAPVLPPPMRRVLTEYTGYFLRAYSALATVSTSSVLVDSSKHPSLAFCLRWRRELDLRVVHVVRDSRAVAFSWTQRVIRPESASGRYMTTYSSSRAAWLWNAQNSSLELLARRGVPTLRVRYEDLVSAPAATLETMASFAGITVGGTNLAFLTGDAHAAWANLGMSHTVSGNPMRFATGKIPIEADERWRTEMPAARRRTVTALTLPLLARYGYATARHGWPTPPSRHAGCPATGRPR